MEDKDIKIIKDLINDLKQQETITGYNAEIEKYKKLANSNLSDELIFSERICPEDTFIIQENYISKDKIREKIKELEDNMILFTNDKEKFNRYKYARNILEKLLEEK